ncbi:hypothetical protein, partial [Phocaeicola vulgatus]|uniref:hypothetical protein n=1 Tax=Phocaeicola vulgatus TaxID=821 RepID=UPI0035661A97
SHILTINRLRHTINATCDNHLVLISNKEAFRFPYHGNIPPMLPGGMSARYLRFAYHSIPGFPRG